MSKATVELDFFGRDKEISAKSPFPKFHRQRSLLAISKMNPEILKSVIASGSSSSSSSSNQQNGGRTQFDSKNYVSEDRPVLPVYSPLPVHVLDNSIPSPAPDPAPAPTAPLTIFYNGTVVVLDVDREKAETILKFVENGKCKPTESTDQQQLVDGDLSISRKMSLQRFLEKRKERLTCASPYASKP